MLLPTEHAALRVSADAGEVEIAVADTGPGIAESDQQRIFEKFYRTESSKQMAKGTGLGLAVSYGIIKKHGGDIAVTSAEGTGTTFTVRLPIYGQV